MYFFLVFLFLLVRQFLFLVASFEGLRPVLVTSQCSICSLANKLRSFVRSSYSSRLGRPIDRLVGAGNIVPFFDASFYCFLVDFRHQVVPLARAEEATSCCVMPGLDNGRAERQTKFINDWRHVHHGGRRP